MWGLFALSAGLTCADAEAIADRAMNNPNITEEIAIEVVITLDQFTEGKCNLPGLPDGDV